MVAYMIECIQLEKIELRCILNVVEDIGPRLPHSKSFSLLNLFPNRLAFKPPFPQAIRIY